MKERSEMVEWIRSEIVGPSRPLKTPQVIDFQNLEFNDPDAERAGPLAWRAISDGDLHEVLYYQRESPHRKYGAGLLHPGTSTERESPGGNASSVADTLGFDLEEDGSAFQGEVAAEPAHKDDSSVSLDAYADSDDFEVTSSDMRSPSTMGISVAVRFESGGQLIVCIPHSRRFSWQSEEDQPTLLNGRYEQCNRNWIDKDNRTRRDQIWRRHSAVGKDLSLVFNVSSFSNKKKLTEKVPLPEVSPLSLCVEVFPRKNKDGSWLVTIVMRNLSKPAGANDSSASPRELKEKILYQTYFEVSVNNGQFCKYPESQRPFDQLDPEEQSLALLYSESAVWGIGHGCAAGWDSAVSEEPSTIYADVMPAVQLPSMTPDIVVDGKALQLSMKSLSELPDDTSGEGWQTLDDLASAYSDWIEKLRKDSEKLRPEMRTVAFRHLEACSACLSRIQSGISRLKTDSSIRAAFKLANLAMLLQQIATKRTAKRPLQWSEALSMPMPSGKYSSPFDVHKSDVAGLSGVGSWRAFQAAFLLMSIEGVADPDSADREVVDLIWFPTGGGKTEAYLAVTAFYIFYERFAKKHENLRVDGTNVLMRYTLRMLTTQQFQRAASLICAMEYLRRNSNGVDGIKIGGERERPFSLGLWLGGDGSPNKIAEAKAEVNKFRDGKVDGNPLVLTECPWCRAEIGRLEGLDKSGKWKNKKKYYLCGIGDTSDGPGLHCSDPQCEFGKSDPATWLPVEVVDERIYKYPPSLVIATADKFAMLAYRPKAGALFGRVQSGNEVLPIFKPPGLIIQDELHLISGPLGTMYALYEGVIENLCSQSLNGEVKKPKIIASTATIRGATDQVEALYSRAQTQLFPSPGLTMSDSFFGRYAVDDSGKLKEGRMYLGIHACDYGSVLTAQVRAFSSALFRPWFFDAEKRDPWWTLLAFYNSIRELGGGRTLFDSDIRSRLKYIFNRENIGKDRRNLQIVEELTSRLSQAEIVQMMDRLATKFNLKSGPKTLDSCLASNIIEVGVDIDRLSLMGVVGQPKTTASYIQITGRVGRRWEDRPGLILTIYNPFKSRDRSHFEQFHGYHRRLYERVEPTTATPFAISAIDRGAAGVLIAWARQHYNGQVRDMLGYLDAIESGFEILCERCKSILKEEDISGALEQLTRTRDDLIKKWNFNPQAWEEFPQKNDGEYLMLWPGQYATGMQRVRGVDVPSSMRQVDRNAELNISQAYVVSQSGDESGFGGR